MHQNLTFDNPGMSPDTGKTMPALQKVQHVFTKMLQPIAAALQLRLGLSATRPVTPLGP